MLLCCANINTRRIPAGPPWPSARPCVSGQVPDWGGGVVPPSHSALPSSPSRRRLRWLSRSASRAEFLGFVSPPQLTASVRPRRPAHHKPAACRPPPRLPPTLSARVCQALLQVSPGSPGRDSWDQKYVLVVLLPSSAQA